MTFKFERFTVSGPPEKEPKGGLPVWTWEEEIPAVKATTIRR